MPDNGQKTQPARTPKKPKLILWQKQIVAMLVALIPVTLGSVYFFGLRSLLVVAVCCGVGFACEWLFTRKQGRPVTSAVFVTAILLALSMPPLAPIWVAVIGVAVAVVFGKMAFGGFGFNIFNPAMVGRCFIYISFPKVMTIGWVEPVAGAGGGFARWASVDAITGATPLDLFKTGAEALREVSLQGLFFGNVGGSIGETSAPLILIGAAIILYKKAANWRIVVSTLAGAAAVSAILYHAGVAKVPPPLFTILAGSMLFGAVFIATDPVSAARTSGGMYVYGVLVGALTVVIRAFSGFSEGMTFGVLLGNMFAPITDQIIKELKSRLKARSQPAEEPAAESASE